MNGIGGSRDGHNPVWPVGMEGIDAEFGARVVSVIDLCAGLHHLAVAAGRSVAEHDQLPAEAIADSSLSAGMVPADIRQQASHRLTAFTDAYKLRIRERLDQLDAQSVAEGITDPFLWVATELAGAVRVSAEEARAAVGDLPADDTALVSYLMQYSQAAERPPLLPMMRRALLITAVASAETMLIGVLRRIRYEQGGAGRWGSLLDAPDLDKEIRRLTRGSIEDWVQRLHTSLGIELPAVTCDWAAVTEVWARRHALVHNAGIADSKYADRVAGAAPGRLLEVDDQYLREAIDMLCGFILGVIIQTWAERPGRQSFVLQLTELYARNCAAENRWALAENLHALAAGIENYPQLAAASRVNSWLARIHRRGADSVLDDVTSWDVTQLPRSYALARMILLGQKEQSLAILAELVAQGEITQGNLRNWPLFDSLRDEPGFRHVCA